MLLLFENVRLILVLDGAVGLGFELLLCSVWHPVSSAFLCRLAWLEDLYQVFLCGSGTMERLHSAFVVCGSGARKRSHSASIACGLETRKRSHSVSCLLGWDSNANSAWLQKWKHPHTKIPRLRWVAESLVAVGTFLKIILNHNQSLSFIFDSSSGSPLVDLIIHLTKVSHYKC